VTLSGAWFIRYFKSQRSQRVSSIHLRIINEIPTVLMVIAVAMVVFRPI
jgi:uncharacterized membrane protein